MKFGLIDACDLVGFPYAHIGAFQELADSTNNYVTIVNPAWRRDIFAAHQTIGY